jgi:hypothetical protein
MDKAGNKASISKINTNTITYTTGYDNGARDAIINRSGTFEP